jgi:hypothetical protein
MTDKVISPLRQRVIEDMAIRKLSSKTKHDYVQRVKNFAAFLGATRPAQTPSGPRGAIDRLGPTITTQSIKVFARTARKRCGPIAAATATTIFLRSPNASKSMRKNFASWGPKACSYVRLSSRRAQKWQVLECPLLCRRTRHDSNV